MINRAASHSTAAGRAIRRALAVGLAGLMALAPVSEASAQAAIRGIIRDAEIEATLRAYADPIFAAAGLDTSAVQVHIISNRRINAFVSGGMQIFIHTGLLVEAKTPNELIGVIAHETGHITGGHLARRGEELENRTIEAIIGMLAGIAVGVAAGDAGAGIGAASLGTSIAQKNLLQYSQAQEGAADQAAFQLLKSTEQSPKGMVDFFRVLQRQEALQAVNQDPYMRTHPLTQSRVNAAEAALAQSPYADHADSPEMLERHARMLAKLNGYLQPMGRVLQMYPPSDQSIPARYARAIALYRASRLDDAVKMMDGLLLQSPNDPFFIEQKAQILYENGKIREAMPLYQQALDLAPNETLIRLELGTAQVQSEDPSVLEAAIRNLNEVVRIETRNASAYSMLGRAYYMSGDQPMATLCQAEEALARGKKQDAKRFAERALEGLKVGSPAALRAQDIQFAADQGEDE